jgi:hypothetical protein
MPKRKRSSALNVKQSVTAGPFDEVSGQRSVFPQLVSQPSRRDTEWRYDDQEEEAEYEEEYQEEDDEEYQEEYQDKGLVGQTFSLKELQYDVEEEMHGHDDEADLLNEKDPGNISGSIDEDEWEEEPQTEVIAYLQTVRTEAEALPSLVYDPRARNGVNGIGQNKATTRTPAEPTPSPEVDNPWRTQFLTFYKSMRVTLASVPEPDLSQNELDSLLHIDPNNRPQNSNQEDGLWRLKTMDKPSITLLSMLDHQRTIHLLIHLRKKMSAKIKEEQCIWFVMLLAKLGDPGVLSGEEVDLLRRVGRKCLNLKHGLQNDGQEALLSTIDMIVCIIKDFYEQRDLEDSVA